MSVYILILSENEGSLGRNLLPGYDGHEWCKSSLLQQLPTSGLHRQMVRKIDWPDSPLLATPRSTVLRAQWG